MGDSESDTRRTGRWRRFSRRYPFAAFLFVVLVNVAFWSAAFYVAFAEYNYRNEAVGFSGFATPLEEALLAYRLTGADAPFNAAAVFEGIREASGDEGPPVAIVISGDERYELRAVDVEDEYGSGVLLYHPGLRHGPFWRKRYVYGLVVYEGLENARCVRLYGEGADGGFSGGEMEESVHGAYVFGAVDEGA